MPNPLKRLAGIKNAIFGHPASPLSSYARRSVWLDRKLKTLSSTGSLVEFEDVLLAFCRHQSPSTWAISHYITSLVNAGQAKRADDLLASTELMADLRPLLHVAVLRRNGDLEAALRAVRYDFESSVVRKRMAEAERGIYHQMRDPEGRAEAAVRFISKEPDLFLAEFGFSAAGAAENASRPDLYATAMSRAVRDVERAKCGGRIQKENWREAARVAMKTFDIDGSLQLLRAHAARGSGLAKREFADAQALVNEIAPWRSVIDMAYEDVRVKASGSSGAMASGKPVVVLHSAGFSTNPIDYPGFRQDIRFVMRSVADALTSMGTDFVVGTKASTHGAFPGTSPYFSYHTIAESPLGLHFKEADRPSLFSFDRRGYSGWSEFSRQAQVLNPADIATATAFFDEDRERVIGGNLSKYAQSERVHTTWNEPFIFVGLQVQSDSVQQLAFMDTRSMLDEVCSTCHARGIAVVVKRHPQCKSPEVARLLEEGVGAGRFTVSTANIHDLLSAAMAVCVVNSAVGAEALLHEKPVYVFGRSEYMQAAYVCEQHGDFERLYDGARAKLSPADLRLFWYLLRYQYAIDLRDRDAAKRKIGLAVERHLMGGAS